MDTFTATMIAEGVEEAEDREEYFAAWQHLIDTDIVWKLQGSFGRQAQYFIDEGVCHN